MTFDRLLHTEKEPHNWLTYSGNMLGQRYSPLTQINTGNVKNLELQWVWQAQSLEKYETTSLVIDGILYTVQAPTTRTTRMGTRRSSLSTPPPAGRSGRSVYDPHRRRAPAAAA